jgi:hypothetical protein
MREASCDAVPLPGGPQPQTARDFTILNRHVPPVNAPPPDLLLEEYAPLIFQDRRIGQAVSGLPTSPAMLRTPNCPWDAGS